jgi:hypothetical protein
MRSTDGECLTEPLVTQYHMAEKKRAEPFSRPCGTQAAVGESGFSYPTSQEALGKNDFTFAALEGEKLFLGLYVDCFGCALDAILQSKQDIHNDRSTPTQ